MQQQGSVISAPLRDRFGVVMRLSFYDVADLSKIVERTSGVYKTEIHGSAVSELSKRSRGTPRIANRLFRRVRDFAEIIGDGIITKILQIMHWKSWAFPPMVLTIQTSVI